MDAAHSGSETSRRVSRYAALGMGLVAVAGIGLALSLFFLNREQRAVRLDLEKYHLRSTSLASGLADDLARLRWAIFAPSTAGGAYDARTLERGAALASARVTIEQLEAIRRDRRDDAPARVLQAVAFRFDRVASLLQEGLRNEGERDLSALRVAFASLSLSVQQLRRLHAIDAREHVAEIASGSAQRNRALALTAIILLLAAVAVTRVLSLVRQTFAREAELRASIEAARRRHDHGSRMEALGRLAGGVAHDFNNLLTVILAHSEAIHDSQNGARTLQRETEGIELAIDQATALTRQLLTFSRTGASKPRRIDLNQITRDMEILLSRLLGGRCKLVTNLSPDLGATRADPREIERVLVNLVSNAGDAMPNGGTVVIETVNIRAVPRHASASADSELHDFVRLSICDTGTGMTDETRHRVFDPFFTTKSEGMGLGLSTVYGMVEKAGGWVEVESELEIGTRVDLYLPRQEREPEDDGEPETVEGAVGSETILVVDDEAEVRRSCARTLRQAGYTVLESPDGPTALELCGSRSERVDLILTDVMMPGMTGPELVERAKFLLPETPALFMSGYARVELPPGGKVLAKPFGRSELLSHVRSSIDS